MITLKVIIIIEIIIANYEEKIVITILMMITLTI
jgi:hypothetical protein